MYILLVFIQILMLKSCSHWKIVENINSSIDFLCLENQICMARVISITNDLITP